MRDAGFVFRAAVALGLVIAFPVSAHEKTLYERLGCYDAIEAVVGEFADRLNSDPELQPQFGGFSADRLQKVKEFNIQMVCQVSGGPCVYQGRDMMTTHNGSGGVTDAKFDRVAMHLSNVLDEFKVPAAEKEELLTTIGTLRGDIVDQN